MKRLCMAVMAVCMLLSCAGNEKKEATTLSGLQASKFVADVNGKTVEKDYKNVQLSGSYEGGIE